MTPVLKQQIKELENKYGSILSWSKDISLIKGDNTWNRIAWMEIISEDFIKEFQDKFSAEDWEGISRRQTLSEQFIKDMDKLNKWNVFAWEGIAYNHKLSDDFVKNILHKKGANNRIISDNIAENPRISNRIKILLGLNIPVTWKMIGCRYPFHIANDSELIPSRITTEDKRIFSG